MHGIPYHLRILVILAFIDSVVCFGAGSIPNFTYLNDKAFRHGDIEEVLTTLVKNVHLGGSEGMWGIVMTVMTLGIANGERKFSKMDASRIYFGNWLRDFSQAMDIGGLSTFTAPTLMMIVSVLGFMSFGFATAEFEITEERLGVYLPVEHIDNPKGYGDNVPDPRSVHPKLRPPVDPRELEINLHNGMKNYIATENEFWDTSTAHIRRTLLQCIAHGRKSKGKENHDQYEAFRLLGSALHTLEDLTAHSNWCELALRKMGHENVFCYVGDEVIIETPSGPAPPLVTGTFGSADFMHSVLGEGMDRLSEVSMSNLAGKISEAKERAESHIPLLHDLLNNFLTSTHTHSEKMKQAEEMKNKAYSFNVHEVAPEEILDFIWTILTWRDILYKDVLKAIAMIPGLVELFEKLVDVLNAFVYSLLDPILQPILQEITESLQEESKAIIDSKDQHEVFDNPHASDPSHSILAKDHFALILNEPAGKVARVIVEYTVNLVVKAWCEERLDVNALIDKILECFHHPYFASPTSEIQQKMMEQMNKWLVSLAPDDADKVLRGLTKEGVRVGLNKRFQTKEELVAEEAALHLRLEEQRISAEAEKQTAAQRASGAALLSAEAIAAEQKKERDLRGVRYKVEMRPPVFSRFDGTRSIQRRYQRFDANNGAPQQPRRDDRDDSGGSDDEFWRDPYRYARQRPTSINQRPQNPHENNENHRPSANPYYDPQPSIARAGPPPEHWFAPPRLLAEVENGFRAAFADLGDNRSPRQNYHRRSFSNRSSYPRDYPRARSPSLEDRWPRELVSVPEEGIEPVRIDIRSNDVPEGYPRQYAAPSNEPYAYQRFDPSVVLPRPVGPGQDVDEGPPAFFVRGQYGGPGYDPRGYNEPRVYGYGEAQDDDNKQPEYGFPDKKI